MRLLIVVASGTLCDGNDNLEYIFVLLNPYTVSDDDVSDITTICCHPKDEKRSPTISRRARLKRGVFCGLY